MPIVEHIKNGVPIESDDGFCKISIDKDVMKQVKGKLTDPAYQCMIADVQRAISINNEFQAHLHGEPEFEVYE